MDPPRPRELEDLPFARFLGPYEDEPVGGSVLDSVRWDGATPEGLEADDLRVLESALVSVTVTGGRMRRGRFNDVWMHGTRWVGTDLAKGVWADVEVGAGSFAGVDAYTSDWQRVTFFGCKLDSVNLRGSTLRDVAFVDCLLREVDLAAAALTSVSFPGSTLDGVRLRESTLEDVDLRRATSVRILDGAGGLRGATISSTQLIDLAPELALALGVDVS